MGLKVFTTGGDYPDQYNITREDGREFNESGDYLRFSGYFGEYGPHVFAAAPELIEALEACSLELNYCQKQLAAHGQTGNKGDSVSRALAQSSAAIAKAKGDVA